MTPSQGSAQAALLARILSDTTPPAPTETFPGADLLPPAFRRPASGPVGDSATVSGLTDCVECPAAGPVDDPAPEPDDAVATAEAAAEGLSGCVEPSGTAPAAAIVRPAREAASEAAPLPDAPAGGLDAAGEIRARVVAALGYGPGTDGRAPSPEPPNPEPVPAEPAGDAACSAELEPGDGSYRRAKAPADHDVLRPQQVLPVGDVGEGLSRRVEATAAAVATSADAGELFACRGDLPSQRHPGSTGVTSGSSAPAASGDVRDADALARAGDGEGLSRRVEAAADHGVLQPQPEVGLPVGDGGEGSGRRVEADDRHDVLVSAPGAGSGGGDTRALDAAAGPAGKATRRRGPADPVRGVMHRHEELCAGAVDVLEIAAGLEAHGVTDRVAGRFRHRDVFSLADELYARVPHGAAAERAVGRVGPVRVGVLHLVPGAGCAAAAAFVVRSPAVGAVVALLVALATWAALRRGPLRTEGGGGALSGGWLLAFALCGGPLLAGLLDEPFDPPATGPFVALTLTLAPAAWCAHRFALRARAELALSRGLGEFAARVRPLLAGTLVLYLAVLLAVLWAAAALGGPAGVAGAAALGMLLFTARLLAVHGFTRAAAWGTGAAAAAEGGALGAAVLRHVPGLAALAAPVEWAGPAAIPAVACGCAATVLVAHAFRALTRASAHPRTTDLRNTNQENR